MPLEGDRGFRGGLEALGINKVRGCVEIGGRYGGRSSHLQIVLAKLVSVPGMVDYRGPRQVDPLK